MRTAVDNSDAVVVAAELVITSSETLSPGWVTVTDGRIAAVHAGAPPEGATLRPGRLVPGLVDNHVHGALGIDFGAASAEEARDAARYLWSTGTTTVVASIATASHSQLLQQIDRLSPLVDDGTLAGLHLEGPYLSAAHAGAHSLELLRDPDLDEIESLLQAADGRISMFTLAPELPGAMEAVRLLSEAGVVVAIGHTKADGPTVLAALDAGATVATHLFNGMPPFVNRSPGPVGTLLTDRRVAVELILDGQHLSFESEQIALRTAADRVVGVSDAMAATGHANGTYNLAGSEVVVTDGVARTACTGSLAGSTSPLHRALQRLVTVHHLDEPAAVRMLATRPADLIARPDIGRLEPGAAADLVLLSADLEVTAVMRRGAWL